MAIERTLSIVKPDGVQNGHIGHVISHFEHNGMRIRAMRMVHLTRAQAERLAPLLYAVCRTLPLRAPVRDRLRAQWLALQRQHLLGLEQLRQVLAAFEAAGIRAIPLKGPALGDVLYREPALRPFTDLDLLIRRSEERRVGKECRL